MTEGGAEVGALALVVVLALWLMMASGPMRVLGGLMLAMLFSAVLSFGMMAGERGPRGPVRAAPPMVEEAPQPAPGVLPEK